MNGQGHTSPLRSQGLAVKHQHSQSSSQLNYSSHQTSLSNLHGDGRILNQHTGFIGGAPQYGRAEGRRLLNNEEMFTNEQFRKKETEERVTLPYSVHRAPSLSPVPQEKRSSLYNISPDRYPFPTQELGGLRDLSLTSGKKSSDLHIRELDGYHSKAPSINSTEE